MSTENISNNNNNSGMTMSDLAEAYAAARCLSWSEIVELELIMKRKLKKKFAEYVWKKIKQKKASKTE